MKPFWHVAAGVSAVALVALGTAPAWGWRALRLYKRRRRRETHKHRAEQPQSEGVGPLYARRYSIAVEQPRLSAEALMAEVAADPNAFCPHHLAEFEKVHGAEGLLSEGDDFYIHISGPWNGPVRVVGVTPTAFTLATLEDHMEAGRIRFSAEDRAGELYFSIVSCARSSDLVVDFFYDKLGLARQAQTHMWTVFCERVAEQSGGQPAGDVEVHTWSGPPEALPAPEVDWAPYRERLDRIHETGYNYDPALLEHEHAPEGWYDDDYEVDLPAEPPGPPVDDGAWEHARAFIEAYRFPDPRLLRGFYDPEAPLAERTMVLKARFLGFTFTFDVRIEEVVDEVVETGEGPARVWGYSYRTLEGHFERGEIFFEVWKYLETGRVAFKVHARSSRAPIPNPFYRVGFRIFGRMLQRQFAVRARARVAEHVRAALARQTCQALHET